MRIRIQTLVKLVKTVLHKLQPYRLRIGVAVGMLAGIGVIASFLPQTIAYDFAQTSNCRLSPRLLPQLSKIEAGSPFRVHRPPSLAIGKVHLYARTVCATAQSAPAAETTASYKERLFGWPFLGHSLRVKTFQYPALAKTNSQLLPPDGVLAIKLNQADATFAYAVQAAERTAPCSNKGAEIRCGLEPLQLAYAQAYDLKLLRQFDKRQVSQVGTAAIKTLTPVSIVSTSIAAASQVQQKPTTVSIQTDKKLKSVGTVALAMKNPDGTEALIPSTAHIQDTSVTVTFGQELARKMAFEVRLASLAAEDGSGLVGKAFSLPFTTSGGPKVTGANIGTRNVGTGQAVSVSFDQQLLATQDPAPLVSFIVHGQAYPAKLAVAGNKIVITPQNPLPLCVPFTVKLTAQVQSQYGISGDSAWNFNSRTICYSVFSLGASVRGRAITAYQFGSGANPIVYMGGMHGNEANSKSVMTSWFDELNANPGRLPARSLVVIPAVNPDGLANGSRLNASGVDLNRNFPALDWKSVVTSPENPNPSPAGGPHPLSEPESRAVASYIQRVQPRLVFSFHSAAAIVEANEAGDSVSIANNYASRARYRAVPKSQSAPIFRYDTTGAMEDWMRDRLGRPAIVVELLSKTANEFSRNRDALWYSTGL